MPVIVLVSVPSCSFPVLAACHFPATMQVESTLHPWSRVPAAAGLRSSPTTPRCPSRAARRARLWRWGGPCSCRSLLPLCRSTAVAAGVRRCRGRVVLGAMAFSPLPRLALVLCRSLPSLPVNCCFLSGVVCVPVGSAPAPTQAGGRLRPGPLAPVPSLATARGLGCNPGSSERLLSCAGPRNRALAAGRRP